MKTLVVYDSVYGNTEIIAQAIAAAISGDVEVLRVGQAKPADLELVDLLLIGSPTHGSLPTEAVQRLLDQVGSPAHDGATAATFDTRLTWRFLERWGGFASPKMAESLKEKSWPLAGEPGGFFVRGLKKGPLKRGEVERAAAWAAQIAARFGSASSGNPPVAKG
jgi:flavodoxin